MIVIEQQRAGNSRSKMASIPVERYGSAKPILATVQVREFIRRTYSYRADFLPERPLYDRLAVAVALATTGQFGRDLTELSDEEFLAALS